VSITKAKATNTFKENACENFLEKSKKCATTKSISPIPMMWGESISMRPSMLLGFISPAI
jgi:hypothetical protein